MNEVGEVGQVVKLRGRIRSSITRLVGRAEILLRSDNIPEIASVRDSLEEKLNILYAKDAEVLERIDEEDLEIEEEACMNYELKIRKTISMLNERLEKLRKLRTEDSEKFVTVSVKLPKIQLPTFSGNKMEWQSFSDIFKSAVSNNKSLANAEKMTYLKTCLKGEAKSSIEGLTLTDSNYETAMNVLQTRFGDNEAVVREHMRKLQSLKCPTTSLPVLKQFHDDILKHTRCLQNLKVEVSQYEVMLTPSLLSKLPESLRLNILSRAADRGMSVSKLSYFLELLFLEIQVREISKENSLESKNETGGFHGEGSATSLKTDTRNKNDGFSNYKSGSCQARSTTGRIQDKKIFCTYCEGEHSSTKCTVHSNVSDRIKVLKEQKRCFSCLRRNHDSRNCMTKRKCVNCSGSKFHHYSICPSIQPQGTPLTAAAQQSKITCVVSKSEEYDSKEKIPSGSLQTLLLSGPTAVAMPTAKAFLSAGEENSKEIAVRLILDSGSNRTYVRKDLTEILRIKPIVSELLKVNTFGSKEVLEHESEKVVFTIRKCDSEHGIQLTGNTVETICSPQNSISVDEYPHFSNLDLADPHDERDRDMEIGVLIGADQFYDIVEGEVVRGKYGPTAISSKLGWLTCGRIFTPDQDVDSSVSKVLFSERSEVTEDLKRFWEFDHIGILPNELHESNSFLPFISHENNQYTVGLPWKSETAKSNLPSNFNVSQKRLFANLYKLRKQPKVCETYHATFEDHLKKNMIESAPVQYAEPTIHYMPHRAVIRPERETTKLRIVFDASCREKPSSLSLNECLDKGPCSLPQIPLLLTSFRFNKIGILADIEKAFMQIKIAEKDRDALRFLWVDDPRDPKSPIKQYRHVSLVFGLTSSPAVLEQVIQHHLAKFEDDYPSEVNKLKQMYVDNVTTGCADVSEACHLYEISRDIFSSAHFNLRQWKSNSEEFNKFVVENEQSGDLPTDPSYSALTLNTELASTTKVLGLAWDTQSDEFEMNLTTFAKYKHERPVKRTILQLTARVYDPLGFLCPILILPKLLFQKLDDQKWDNPLPLDIEEEWKDWINQLCSIKVKIQRYIFTHKSSTESVQLHIFSDASKDAYASVAYLRVLDMDQSVTVSLLFAKSKVAPKAKPQTIPRLELMGTLLSARIVKFLLPSLPPNILFCWSDSQNALNWICGENKVWKVFVENRVQEIRKSCPPSHWRFVPGDSNPADIPSRGLPPNKLESCEMWWNGPAWLHKGEDDWPSQTAFQTDEYVTANVSQIETDDNDESMHRLQEVMPVKRYSSFQKLVRITAWVFRFVDKLRRKPITTTYLSQEEVRRAEIWWIKSIQTCSFQKEFRVLHSGKILTKSHNLHLFLDGNDVIRTKGRLSSCVPYETNCPMLIPGDSEFHILVVNDAHTDVFHGGVSATLAKVRERFWLIRGRQRVKTILHRCVTCRRVQGLPYAQGVDPDLPEFRVQSIRAFFVVGIDYCGPLVYRKGEETLKAYILLFTCTSTRALHLEVVPDMSATTFIRALKRFVARRGIPGIISDNFATFKMVNRQLNNPAESDRVRHFVSSRNIEWQFTCERAPWWGGFFERMIKEVKLSLKKTIQSKLLEFEELMTLVIEIEGVLNSRPLCYVGEETEEIVTPAHFLILQRMTKSPESSTVPELNLLTRYRSCRNLIGKFWDYWTKLYLLSLRERCIRYPRGTQIQPEVGQVVLLKEPILPRLRWKIGRIQECIKGRDGNIRSALVRVSRGRGGRPEVLRRPVRLLCPVEFSVP